MIRKNINIVIDCFQIKGKNIIIFGHKSKMSLYIPLAWTETLNGLTISGGVNISSTQLSHKSSEVASANKNRGSSAFLQQKLVGHSRILRGTCSDTVIEKDSDWSFLSPLMGFQRFRKLYESKRCTRKHKRQNRKLKMSDIPCAKIPRKSQIFVTIRKNIKMVIACFQIKVKSKITL